MSASGADFVDIANGSNAELRMVNRELDDYMTRSDILMGLSELSLDGKTVPDSYITRIKHNDMEGRKVSRMLMDLIESGSVGDIASLESTGEYPRFKTLTDTINVFAKVMNRKSPEYTIGGLLTGKQFFNQARAKLPKWMSIERGIYARRAAVERIAYPLLSAAPWNLSAGLNANNFVVTVSDADQPVYDSNPTTLRNNLIASLKLASFAADDQIIADSFSDLEFFVNRNWRMVPPEGKFGGMFAALLGDCSIRMLEKFSSVGSLVQIRQSTLDSTIAKSAFLRTMGSFKQFELYKDGRAPIGVLDTDDDSFEIVYCGHGEIDARKQYRTGGSIKVFEAVIILGKGGIRNPFYNKPTYLNQNKNFDLLDQMAAVCIEGYNTNGYDNPTSATIDDDSNISQGSAIMWVPVP